MKYFATITVSLCIGITSSVTALELNSGSFKINIPDQWKLIKSDNNTYIYKNQMDDKIRLTHTDAFETYDRSEEVLKSVMQDSAVQPGLKIKAPLKKYKIGTNNIWFIGSTTQTESQFLYQYGLVGGDQVIFVAHTCKALKPEDKDELLKSLSKVEWLN
ncbi:MAG: hypothetical protein P8163_12360 [Candidatus Thiodiazotropha sp.]